MKRLFLLAGVLCALSASAQFPNTDSLHRYNNRYIRNSAVEAFSNLRLNTLLHGIIQWIDSAAIGIGAGGGVDTLYAVNDSTIRYRKNGINKNFTLKGVYDTRRKVDSAFALNDSTIRFKINGQNRDVVIRGATGGTGGGNTYYGSPVIDWYVDSRAGNDRNTGREPGRPLKTIAALLSKGYQKGDRFNLFANSYWRERIAVGDSITVQSYGPGAKPVLDGSDTAYNRLFTKTGGRTYTYQIQWTNDFKYNDVNSKIGVWENGRRLRTVGSIAAVDATPGTIFVSGTLDSFSTNTVYIRSYQSTSPITNNSLYEITRRDLAVYMRNWSTLKGIHGRKSGGGNGLIRIGVFSYAEDVLAEDGYKHNMVIESGVCNRCVAWKLDSAANSGDQTSFVSNTADESAGVYRLDTLTVEYKDCWVLPQINGKYQNTLDVGIYVHGDQIPYGHLIVNGGNVSGCGLGIGAMARKVTLNNVNLTNNATGFNAVNVDTVIIHSSVFNGYGPTLSNMSTSAITGTYKNLIAKHNTFIISRSQTGVIKSSTNLSRITLANNLFYYNRDLLDADYAGGTIVKGDSVYLNARNNIYEFPTTFSAYNITKGTVQGDSNSYSSNNVTYTVQGATPDQTAIRVAEPGSYFNQSIGWDTAGWRNAYVWAPDTLINRGKRGPDRIYNKVFDFPSEAIHRDYDGTSVYEFTPVNRYRQTVNDFLADRAGYVGIKDFTKLGPNEFVTKSMVGFSGTLNRLSKFNAINGLVQTSSVSENGSGQLSIATTPDYSHGKAFIKGDNNQKSLTVTGYSSNFSQTIPIQEWRSGAGFPLMDVTEDEGAAIFNVFYGGVKANGVTLRGGKSGGGGLIDIGKTLANTQSVMRMSGPNGKMFQWTYTVDGHIMDLSIDSTPNNSSTIFRVDSTRRTSFFRPSGYNQDWPLDSLGLDDFITKNQATQLIEGNINPGTAEVNLDPNLMEGTNTISDPIRPDTNVIATKEWTLGLKNIDSVTRTPGVDSNYYWSGGVLKYVIKDSIGPGSGGNDDWGAQTAVTDGTTTKGNGTVSLPIRADTTKMATKSYVDTRPGLAAPDGTETKIANSVGYTVSGTGSTTNPYTFTITGTPSSNPFKALTIENYGGVADGSIPLSGAGPFASGTNNTPALQNMLNAAADGQMCIVPSGNWVFNTALDTIKGPTRKYLWILGNTYHNGADFWIVTNGSGAYEQHYFRHDGIAFGRFNFGPHTKNANTGVRQTPLWYQFTGTLIKVYNTNQQVFYLNKVEGFKNAVEFIAKGPFNGSQECTVYARWFNENANGITLTSLNGDSYNDKHKFYVDRIGGGLGIKIDGYSGVVGTDPWNGAFRSLQFYALVERVDSIMDAFGDITEPLFALNVEGGTAFGVFGEYGFNMLSNTSNYVRNPVYRATGIYDYTWVISMGINGRIEVPIWNAGYKYADEAIIMNDGTINCISNSPPAKHVQDAAPARFLFTRAGGPTKDVAVTGTSYTVQFADRYITATNAAGVTINMPAANVNVGRDVTVRNIHSSSVVTFSGATYITTLPNTQAVTLHSNGVIWYPTTNLTGTGGGGGGGSTGGAPWIKTPDSTNYSSTPRLKAGSYVNPTARIDIDGSVAATVGSAPLKIRGGLLNSPEQFALEMNGVGELHVTNSSNVRQKVQMEPNAAEAYQIYRRNVTNTGSEYVDVPYRLLYSNTSAVTVSATSPLTIQSGLGTVVPNYGPNGSKYKFTAEGFVSTTSGSQTLSVYVQPPGMGQIISTFSVPGGLAGDAFSFDFTMTQQGAGYGYTARLKITDASSGSNLFERAVTTSTSSGFNPAQSTPINVSMAWGAGSNSISTRWATWELFRLQ